MMVVHLPLDVYSFYGDEVTGDGTGAGTGTGEKTFTKAELDQMIEQERKVNTDRNRKVLDQLEEFKKNQSLSAQEKETLQKKIDEFQGLILTKDEQIEKERKKAEKKFNEEKEALTKQKDFWESRYRDSTIHANIVSASTTAKAVNPSQILAILGSKASLVEEKDEQGNVSGFSVKIKYNAVKDGKSYTLDLTPAEAIERMKEDEQYQNLFTDTLKGGSGMGENARRTATTIKDMGMSEYLERRKKHGPGAGLEVSRA